MIRFEVLDHQVLLDGKMEASFENIIDAKLYAFDKVERGVAQRADVVNQWTGEVEYHCHETLERRVKEGFDD